MAEKTGSGCDQTGRNHKHPDQGNKHQIGENAGKRGLIEIIQVV